MDQIEKDDFIHALTQTMGFYGKEINKMQTTFWVDACREYPVEKLKLALRQHIQIGKYAPRPADILELCRTMAPLSGTWRRRTPSVWPWVGNGTISLEKNLIISG